MLSQTNSSSDDQVHFVMLILVPSCIIIPLLDLVYTDGLVVSSDLQHVTDRRLKSLDLNDSLLSVNCNHNESL